MGWRQTPDFNGPEPEGVGLWEMTIRNGIRASASNAFLRPAMKRKNLDVRAHVHVTGIIFSGRRATGVAAVIGGERVTFSARREVILSGGAINSPQLLQLSGIGDADLLRANGIEVRHHSPQVGQGLQDHLCVSYFYKSRVPTLNNTLYPLLGKLGVGLKYLLTRRGPLGMSVNQAGAFVRSRDGLDRPNMHLYFNPISYTTEANQTRAPTQSRSFPCLPDLF